MPGTIIITGANGSLAIPAVQHLLQHSSAFTLVLAVRSAAESDVHTNELRAVIAKHDSATASIRELDLSNLGAVTEFANSVAAEISQGALPPLAGIVCNAFYWNLATPPEVTADGFEKTFQVNHIAHAALVLRLLGSFNPTTGGRVVLLTTDGIEPGKNNLEKYPPGVPDQAGELDALVKLEAKDPTDDPLGYGFQRYANSKLVVLLWALALNRRLEKDAKLQNITVAIINPGNLADSRALQRNTPKKLQLLGKYLLRPLLPVLRFADKLARTSAEAGADIASWVANETHPGERGYYLLTTSAEIPGTAKEETKQEAVWTKTALWAGVTAQDTAVEL